MTDQRPYFEAESDVYRDLPEDMKRCECGRISERNSFKDGLCAVCIAEMEAEDAA